MNTIEMKVGNKSVQFTTKSLIIDGKEFYYHKMSDIKHSASKHVYAFTYDDKQEYLPYDPKYEKGLKVIFGKIHALGKSVAKTDAKATDAAIASKPVADQTPDADAKEEPAAPALAEEPAPEATSEEAAEAAPAKDADAVPSSEPADAPAADEASAAAPAKTPEEETVFDIPAEAEEDATDASGNAPSEAAAAEPADSKSATNAASDAPAAEDETAAPEVADAAEGTNAEGTEEAPAEEPPIPPEEKKGKLKKSILVLIGILAVIAVLAVIYFATIGTSDNPKAGPNSTESQQYDNIDELIEDLDN